MKDKKAREEIEELLHQMECHIKSHRRNLLLGLSIKDCPKCKHLVLAKEWVDLWSGNTAVSYPTHFQCLTCGVKFTCSNECVCKIIEPKSSG